MNGTTLHDTTHALLSLYFTPQEIAQLTPDEVRLYVALHRLGEQEAAHEAYSTEPSEPPARLLAALRANPRLYTRSLPQRRRLRPRPRRPGCNEGS